MAMKSGHLPERLREMKCGPLSHARWLTTGQRILFLWTRKYGTTGKDLKVLRILVNFCPQVYFKVYFNISQAVHPRRTVPHPHAVQSGQDAAQEGDSSSDALRQAWRVVRPF